MYIYKPWILNCRFLSGHLDTMNMKDLYQQLIPITEPHFLWYYSITVSLTISFYICFIHLFFLKTSNFSSVLAFSISPISCDVWFRMISVTSLHISTPGSISYIKLLYWFRFLARSICNLLFSSLLNPGFNKSFELWCRWLASLYSQLFTCTTSNWKWEPFNLEMYCKVWELW